eukprot:CAMPEP_0185156040 /NCGR_PEP_ID=MMETSP1139-20130426/840_1 /TAXON_ID=298111 /ORGANISM="Pavlova sp., Strain CCMP459" /LENGTH=56 /DNA_ID=CAMNT_0027720993 /DNA_START=46 /DNA_END=213 /DNA_ORIENTATION=+
MAVVTLGLAGPWCHLRGQVFVSSHQRRTACAAPLSADGCTPRVPGECSRAVGAAGG